MIMGQPFGNQIAQAGAQNGGFGQLPGMGGMQAPTMGQMFGADPVVSQGIANMDAMGQARDKQYAAMDQMLTGMQMVVQMFMMKSMQAMMSSAAASFGGGGGNSGSPGVGNFLGGGGGGGGTAATSDAPSVGASEMGGATDWGKSLAKDAEKNADGPGGYCYKWVAEALARHGVKVHGASAYMAAEQLAKSDKFREVKVDQKDFKGLPAGAVVVWDKGNGHEHGHISIALGDGREASDKIRNQITNYGTAPRVFLPK